MRYPTDDTYVSSGYGWRTGLYGELNWHGGCDFPRPWGGTIYAIADGTVVRNNWSNLGGWTVTIAHKDGVNSIYQHLKSQPNLAYGSFIKEGAKVGTMGSTGQYTNGVHLHFETWRNGQSIDPEVYLKAGVGAGNPSDGGSTDFPDKPKEWDEMASPEEIRAIVREEVARGTGKAVWGYKMAGGDPVAGKQVPAETAGERLRQVRRSTFNTGTIIRATYATVRKVLAVVTGLANPPQAEPVADPTSPDNA